MNTNDRVKMTALHYTVLISQ